MSQFDKRLPVLLGETEEQKKHREAEEARLKEQRIRRLKRRMARVTNGKMFTGKPLHETFSEPRFLLKQINDYFALCELEVKPFTVPGLALALGLRTAELLAYAPDHEQAEYKRLSEFAIQRIEDYMATGLFKGTGSTKGKEFLAQNTLGYANKSQVNAQVDQTLTEKKRLETLGDDELAERIRNNQRKVLKFLPKIAEEPASGE